MTSDNWGDIINILFKFNLSPFLTSIFVFSWIFIGNWVLI